MKLETEALELASVKHTGLPDGVGGPTKLSGGSSGDEKSELSKVDSETHSSK